MIEFAALASAFLRGLGAITALLSAAGVPIPPGLAEAMTKGLPGVVDLLKAVGCLIHGCPDDFDKSDAVDEASAFRDAFGELSAEAAGIKPSGR